MSCFCLCRHPLLHGHDHSSNASDSQTEVTPKKPHIKKPLNAFMLFMKEQRAKVAAECTLKESAAINQILGRRVSERFSTYFTFLLTLLCCCILCHTWDSNLQYSDPESKAPWGEWAPLVVTYSGYWMT